MVNQSWQITTQPSVEPITLIEAKLHLKVENSADDALITSLIVAARQWCEAYTNRALITQTITLKRDDIPCQFIVPKPKLQSVTSIKYVDLDGDQQTIASSVYDVDVSDEPGRVGLAYNQSWPDNRGDINSVEMIFIAGYGVAAAVPDVFKAAIKLLIGHWYDNRSDVCDANLSEIPFGAKALISIYRRDTV